MTAPHRIPALDELLRHLPWLQKLASSLISDRHQAEDLVQETLHAAIRTPPRERSVRAWLGTVARRSAVRLRRADQRRRSREEQTARSESVPGTSDAVAALEAHRRLTQAVLELPEPYRSAIVMRYYRQLDIVRIARATGSTETNVRTRLNRAIGMLRARLGRDLRASCLAVLGLPPALNPPLPPWPLAGPLTMKKNTLLLAITVLLCVSLPILAFLDRGGSEPPAGVAAEVSDAGTSAASPVATDVSVPRAPVLDPGRSRTDPAMRKVRCRVLDARGNPVPGARVAARHFATGTLVAEATGDGEGLAVLGTPKSSLILGLEFPHATLRSSLVPADVTGEEFTIVAADPITLVGTVHAQDGSPVANAVLSPKSAELIDFPLPQDSHLPPGWPERRSDAAGLYRFTDLPRDASMQLEVAAQGYRTEVCELLPLLDHDGRITLQPVGDPRTLYGRVQDPNGVPVADATVGLDRFRTVSAADGSYRLRVWTPESLRPSDRLYACRQGFAPLLVDGVVPQLRAAETGELHRDLVLEGDSRSLAGVVQRTDGTPVEGVWVICEGAYIDRQGTQLESLSRADTDPDVAYGRAAGRTNPDGRFTVAGLRDAEYALIAIDPDTLGHVRLAPVRSGADDIEIVWPDDTARPLRGLAIDELGAPVAGLEVSVYVTVVTDRARATRTDERGRFAFDAVPAAGARLTTRGNGMQPEFIHLRAEHFDDGLELRVTQKHYLQVALPPDHPAGKVSILSDTGEQLTLSRFDAVENWMWVDWDLRNGRTTVLTAPANTAFVVLKDADGTELERIPVKLVPGEVVVVR